MRWEDNGGVRTGVKKLTENEGLHWKRRRMYESTTNPWPNLYTKEPSTPLTQQATREGQTATLHHLSEGRTD
ncbi:hypothetical protein Pmani_031365 [Petrolisthes manimaculis]|uniref:Uncharacterized protein n=1 Tax=Petrolisthes manimaculis TaxID=1843537 RepID=A0AAE1TUY2_9EUCA|nr:hypothetical protein Pmani_031365 [Petrolisthes manimaculis]